MTTPVELTPGAWHHPGFLSPGAQAALLAAVLAGLPAAPWFRPAMPRTGRPFSVRMTNRGPLGWVSDAAGGYRYQATHPDTGAPWGPIPALALDAWARLAPGAPEPEACLVNLYEGPARMGLHQDRDEEDLSAPVVSLSLGDEAVFRVGGAGRRDPTRSVRLASGDAFVLGGPARLAFHGIDRVRGGSSRLIDGFGRINLTLRRATRPRAEP